MVKKKRGVALLLSTLMACSMFSLPASAEDYIGPVSDSSLSQWSQSLTTNEQYFMMEYLEKQSGWKSGYDIISQSPWLYNSSTKMLFSYESQRSLKARTDYIKNNNLSGCIVWDAQGDKIGTVPMFKTLQSELKNQGKDVIAYFGNWMAWGESSTDHTQGQDVTTLPWNQVTCINYSFFGISNGQTESLRNSIAIPKYKLVTLDEHLDFGLNSWSDPTNAAKAAKYGARPEEWSYNLLTKIGTEKAKYSGVDLMLSVGGWTRSNMFHEMASTAANRKVFIDSCVEFLKDYPHFNGIDLDWEYPGVARTSEDQYDAGNPAGPEDRANMVALVKELRAAFDANFPGQGKKITTCAASAPEKLSCFDAVEIAKYVDKINIMTYDYYGNWDSSFQGYISPLYNENSTAWCTDNSVKWFINAGVDPSKINIGSPFYAYGYKNVSADANGNPSSLKNPMVKGMTSNNMTISNGETKEVDASYTFTDNSTKKVSSIINAETATSSNTSVVRTNVDSKTGKVTVTGVSAGTATVTVASPSDSISTTFTVTVSGSGSVTTSKEFVMKLNTTYAFNNGKRFATDGYNNDNGGTYYAQMQMVNGRTLLPIRYVAESLGLTVGYDANSNSTTVSDGVTTVIAPLGSSLMTKITGGYSTTVDAGADAVLIRNVTHVPVRALLEAFNLTVNWDDAGYLLVTDYTPTSAQTSDLLSRAKALIG